MASIFQPVYVKKLADGRRVRRKSKVWRIEYFDPGLGRRVRKKGFRDKMATDILAADLERRAERRVVGAVDEFEEARATPLEQHFSDYQVHLANSGVSQKHLAETSRRIKELISHSKVVRLHEIRPAHCDGALKAIRTRGAGPRTLNTYGASWRAFIRWAIRSRRLSADADPTVTIAKLRESEDVRRQRRALVPKEIERLLTATASRPLAEAIRKNPALSMESRRALTLEGIERALIYKTAILTGLRRGEIEALRWSDLQLDSKRPNVHVRGSVAKNGREEYMPLRADLAHELSEWRKMRVTRPDEPVFQGLRRIVDHLKLDLQFAGLKYRDESGRFFDFHAFRHCTASYLARGGVAPRVAQSLMRHADIGLTMGAYTDPMLLDKVSALDALPILPRAVLPEGLFVVEEPVTKTA